MSPEPVEEAKTETPVRHRLPTREQVEASLSPSELARYKMLKRGMTISYYAVGPAMVAAAYLLRPQEAVFWGSATALGYWGGLIKGAPMDTAVGLTLTTRTRDFFAHPFSPAESFFRGLKAGAWDSNPLGGAVIGVLSLFFLAKAGFDCVKKRICPARPEQPKTPAPSDQKPDV